MPLTTRELELYNKFYNQYKENPDKFINQYGSDAEKVARGRAVKLAQNTTMKEQKTRIKEAIKIALMKGPVEEINSAEFVQSRKDNDTEKNPVDTVRMDVPLLIRVMEFAKEEAKTDMDLHSAAENMIELSKNDRILNMDDYNSIFTPDENTKQDRLQELAKQVLAKLKSK
jgi:hypothetical protein